MEVLHPRCAGIDVHKKEVVVAVRVAQGRKVDRALRTYGTTTRELLRLSDWLTEYGVTHVVMESTGAYWRPVWHVLDGTFELILANARDVKNVPGRKTDAKDAEWLAELLAHGLVRGSFVPDEPILELRDLTRTRKQLVRERGRHVQRLQKILEFANIKLSSVITDILGLSGRKILVALIEGETDPDRLAALGHIQLKASKSELSEALRGRVTRHHRFMLRLHFDQINALDQAIAEVEEQLEKCLEPFRSSIEHLDTIPGVNWRTAAVIVAEIGVDMSRFPTCDDLISWAGLCRRLNETAGKRRSTRLRKGGNWLKETLVSAAWAAVKQRNTYLHAKYLRLKRHSDANCAIIGVARSMLTSAYYMIRDQKDYRDLGPDHFQRFDRDKLARRLIERLQDLGLDVDVRARAA